MFKAQWRTKHTDSQGYVDFDTLQAVAKQLITLFHSKQRVIGILNTLKREKQVHYKIGSTYFECFKVAEYKEPDDISSLTMSEAEALAEED